MEAPSSSWRSVVWLTWLLAGLPAAALAADRPASAASPATESTAAAPNNQSTAAAPAAPTIAAAPATTTVEALPPLPAPAAAPSTDSAEALPPAPPPPPRYVVLGPGGKAWARTIVAAKSCPDLVVDGSASAMHTRALPASLPGRGDHPRSWEFPVRVCEAPVPADAQSLQIEGAELPLPRAVQRIVVLGDTGCRMKAKENLFQDCSSETGWPFAAVAAAAAAEHPDLVIHVGDYHYRESPCPAAVAGCRNSPWGYGWDAWNADFFEPARALLQAAPWIVVRGNHEECARAGLGWFRFLDPAPYDPARNCVRPGFDAQADFSDPYAVPLGAGWQALIFDSAFAGGPDDPGKPQAVATRQRYEAKLRELTALAARPELRSFFISHHPVLGLTPRAGAAPVLGTPLLTDAARHVAGEHYFAEGIMAALHGHVHELQLLDFSSGQPATVVAGDSGDMLDPPLPAEVGPGFPDAPGVRLATYLHAERYGYLVIDREGEDWHILARALDGSSLADCVLSGARLECDRNR